MTTALLHPKFPGHEALERYDAPPQPPQRSRVVGVGFAQFAIEAMAASTAKPRRVQYVTEGGPSLILPEALEADAMPFTHDPFADWIDAHRAEMARHVGLFVVIDPKEGILEAGDDPIELSKHNRPSRPVMVTFVAADLYASP